MLCAWLCTALYGQYYMWTDCGRINGCDLYIYIYNLYRGSWNDAGRRSQATEKPAVCVYIYTGTAVETAVVILPSAEIFLCLV